MYDEVVHFFKHANETYGFFGFDKNERKQWVKGLLPEAYKIYEEASSLGDEVLRSFKFLIDDYYTMMRTIVRHPEEIVGQPHQFGGYKLVFSKETKSGKYGVIAMALRYETSFILTSF